MKKSQLKESLNEFGPLAGSGNNRANDLDKKKLEAAKKSERGEMVYVVGGKHGTYKLSKYFEKGNTYAAFYNGMPHVVESRQSLNKEVMKKSDIKNLVREAVSSRLLEGVGAKMTVEQFLKLMQQIKQNKLFPNAKWGFAGNAGGGTSYIPFDQFVMKMTDLIKAHKDRKDPITSYQIWNMEGSGLDSTSIKNTIAGGLDAIVQFAQTQGKNVTKISTSWDSNSSQEFGKAMGRGDYDSLDESAMGDIDILAQKSTSFEDFLRRVKQDPKIQKAMEGAPLDDSEMKEFLRDMWNDVEERGDEGRGSSGYLEESIGADIDIIAQESATFQEFLGNIKADSTYKSLDVNDREVMDFLLMMYNDSKGISEAKRVRKLSIKEEIRRAVRAMLKEVGNTNDRVAYKDKNNPNFIYIDKK